ANARDVWGRRGLYDGSTSPRKRPEDSIKMSFATQYLCRWFAISALAMGAGCTAAGSSATTIPMARPGQAVQPDSMQRDSMQPDSTQTMYLANSYTNAILGFPTNADGNVTPTVKIAGNKTLLNQPWALAVDHASGKIFSANEGPDARILIFPKGADGNVA